MHREVLNSLTWDAWFSLINSNLLMFQLPGLCDKSPYRSWLLPYLLGAAHQSHVRGCVLGLSPQFCLPNKTFFSTFRLRLFFFFSQQPYSALLRPLGNDCLLLPLLPGRLQEWKAWPGLGHMNRFPLFPYLSCTKNQDQGVYKFQDTSDRCPASCWKMIKGEMYFIYPCIYLLPLLCKI